MKKIVLVFGLIAGLIVTTMMVIGTLMCKNNPNFEASMVIGYTGMLVAFAFIFVAVKNYRDKHNMGALTFWEGFKIGLFITLIASTMYVVSWLIEEHFIFPDFINVYAEKTIQKLKDSGADMAVIKEQTKEMEQMKEMYKNPLLKMLMTYMEILPIGLLVSLIAAAVFRKKPQVA